MLVLENMSSLSSGALNMMAILILRVCSFMGILVRGSSRLCRRGSVVDGCFWDGGVDLAGVDGVGYYDEVIGLAYGNR
jgi:hypothetical protein